MKRSVATFVIPGCLLSLALAILVSPCASTHPDGLERVARDQGFLERAEAAPPAWNRSPIPDYAVPGVASEKLATSIAGLVGVALTFGTAWMVARLVVPRGKTPESP